MLIKEELSELSEKIELKSDFVALAHKRQTIISNPDQMLDAIQRARDIVNMDWEHQYEARFTAEIENYLRNDGSFSDIVKAARKDCVMDSKLTIRDRISFYVKMWLADRFKRYNYNLKLLNESIFNLHDMYLREVKIELARCGLEFAYGIKHSEQNEDEYTEMEQLATDLKFVKSFVLPADRFISAEIRFGNSVYAFKRANKRAILGTTAEMNKHNTERE